MGWFDSIGSGLQSFWNGVTSSVGRMFSPPPPPSDQLSIGQDQQSLKHTANWEQQAIIQGQNEVVGPGSGNVVTGGSGNVVTGGSGNVVTGGSGNIVGNNGGSIIAGNTSRIVGNNGSSIVGNNGAGIVGNNGAGIVGNNGAGIVGNNGAGIVGNNGGSLVAAGRYRVQDVDSDLAADKRGTTQEIGKVAGDLATMKDEASAGLAKLSDHFTKLQDLGMETLRGASTRFDRLNTDLQALQTDFPDVSGDIQVVLDSSADLKRVLKDPSVANLKDASVADLAASLPYLGNALQIAAHDVDKSLDGLGDAATTSRPALLEKQRALKAALTDLTGPDGLSPYLAKQGQAALDEIQSTVKDVGKDVGTIKATAADASSHTQKAVQKGRKAVEDGQNVARNDIIGGAVVGGVGGAAAGGLIGTFVFPGLGTVGGMAIGAVVGVIGGGVAGGVQAVRSFFSGW